MKIKNVLWMVCIACLISSCSSSQLKLQQQIDEMEQQVTSSQDLHQWEELVTLYDKYIEKFPSDSLSPEYLYREANLFRVLKNADRAFNALKTVIDRYPSSVRVPECYFLRGLIYEEVVYDHAMAKQAYLTFLRQYPDHALAESANMSISYLGKSADEIVAMFEANADSLKTTEEEVAETE